MDRAMLQDHLAQAERHVAQGHAHLQRQRQIVAELERDGHASVAIQARELLAQFEELQVIHIADRDRIKQELDNLPTRSYLP